MKTTKLFLIITTVLASLGLLSSCESVESNESNKSDGRVFLSAEGYTSKDATKTSVSGKTVAWVDHDEVLLNNAWYYVLVNEGMAYVESDLSATDVVYGFYPQTILKSNGGTTTPTVTIPDEYTVSYNAGQQIIALPMAAYRTSASNTIPFKQLTAAVCVEVKNTTGYDVTLDKVVVSSAAYKLSGDVTLDLTDNNFGVAAEAGEGAVTVKFSTPITLTNGGSSVEVQVPILPVSASALTIKVYTHTKLQTVVTTKTTGVPETNYCFNFSATNNCGALARNVMASAKVNVGGSNTSVVDHSLFSVSGEKQVRFSPGMLLYQANSTNATEAPYTPKWKFAGPFNTTEQYENSKISESNKDWICLFGYGTTGYKIPDEQSYQTAYQPYSSSVNSDDYLKANIPANKDWGYHAIENGGNEEGYGWRTPTQEEWNYLLLSRGEHCYAPAKVCDVNGFILLPDSWDTNTYSLKNYNTPATDSPKFNDNEILSAEWNTYFAPYGAVFCPNTDYRVGTEVRPGGGYFSYWTSSYDTKAYLVSAYSPSAMTTNNSHQGRAVRLVIDK